MGKVIQRGKNRRKRQRLKERPVAQYYGGSEAKSKELAKRNAKSIDYAEGLAYDGSKAAYHERDQYQNAINAAHQDVSDERAEYWKATQSTLGQNESERLKQLDNELRYGKGADQSLANYEAGRGAILGGAGKLENNDWLNNYNSGRDAILGNASSMEQAGERSAGMLEGYAQNAASEYQSAADKAFNASTERTQRQALGIAAGRGAGAVRQALAGAQGANAQAALDQQVVRAQEANQLNAMRNDAVANAAGIRQAGLGGAADVRTNLGGLDQQAAAQLAANTAQAAAIRAGVGAADQSAAGLQAQREAGARDAAQQGLQNRAGLEQANATYQLQGAGQQAALEQSNLNAGMQAAQLESQVGSGMTGQFLGAEGTQFGAQLGGALQTDAQRQAWQAKQSGLERGKQWTNVATGGILGG